LLPPGLKALSAGRPRPPPLYNLNPQALLEKPIAEYARLQVE
jgi:hypothetical protein